MKGKRFLEALKLDIDKAYDRTSWRFIKIFMECMGFNQHWINLIQEYINTVSFQLLINGAQLDTFIP